VNSFRQCGCLIQSPSEHRSGASQRKVLGGSSHRPVAARVLAVRHHRSRTNRRDWSISCIEPGPTIPCREVSRSTETTRN
jgi:hypothetical protein